MIIGGKRSYRFLLMLLDAAATVAAFYPAYFLAGVAAQRIFPGAKVVLPLEDYWWVPFISIPMWWALFATSGAYNIERLPPTWSSARSLLKPMAIGALIIGFGIFALQEKDFSRRIIGSYLFLNYALIVGERKLFSVWLHRSGEKLNLLIAGSGERAEKLIEAFSASSWDIRLAGIITDSQAGDIQGRAIYSGIDKLPDALKSHPVDGVVVAGLEGGLDALRRIIQCCEDFGVPVLIDPMMLGATISYPSAHLFQGIELIELAPGPHDPVMIGTKRIFDILFSAVALGFFFPVLMFIGILVRLTSPGKALFAQERFGLNGRRFKLYKFRSMYMDAESRLREVTGLNISDGPTFKAAGDPRVTKLGWLMRKFGVDELPQLWNVLRGDMSLVGPRPLQIGEVNNIGTPYRRRLSMRPGLTGLWQVSGGHLLPFDQWMKLDLEYIDTWSIWMDMTILLRTIPVVLMGRNL